MPNAEQASGLKVVLRSCLQYLFKRGSGQVKEAMEAMEATRSTSLSSIASLSPWMRSIDELRIFNAKRFSITARPRMKTPGMARRSALQGTRQTN